MRCNLLLAGLVFVGVVASAASAEPVKKPASQPVLKIVPGKVIVPLNSMHRIWGELVSLDLKTRTGTFRNENNDELMPFVILPYAEMLHHGADGDLEDFRIGEHALFRMHPNDEGKWVWLTYIQDEMFHLKSHGNYYFVYRVDPAKEQIEYAEGSLANPPAATAERLILETDSATHYWKDGRPCAFGDIKIGDKIRAKSHGTGKGKHHCAWEIFLDDASLDKFVNETKAEHTKRLLADGWPGYVDAISGAEVHLTLFQSGKELGERLSPGGVVRVAACQTADLKAADPVNAMLKTAKAIRKVTEVTVELKAPPIEKLVVGGVVRLWIEKAPARSN